MKNPAIDLQGVEIQKRLDLPQHLFGFLLFLFIASWFPKRAILFCGLDHPKSPIGGMKSPILKYKRPLPLPEWIHLY